MRAHYLQHVPFESPAHIEAWLRSAGYEITNTRFYQRAALPDLQEIDLLVVMGGPMSVNDEREFPWLVGEKRFIRNAIEADKAVLGICLGAQLIANAMGCRVYPNAEKEIGWYPIQGVVDIDPLTFRFPPLVEVFHWHGETFDLPSGSIRLATSAGCDNQAFQLGRSVIGLQFHLELTRQALRQLVAHCRAELIAGKYVQSEASMLAVACDNYRCINNLMGEVLSFLTGLEGGRDRHA